MWIRAGPIVLVFLLLLVSPAYADVEWEYFITESDQDMIDMSQTTAKVDNTSHEITLKQILPSSVGLYENSMDYVVLSPKGFKHYSFDGTEMKEIEFLGIGTATNPLAVCVASPYPDTILYDKNKNQVTHYSFMSGMVANPTLSVSGMDNVISIGTRNLDLAFIQDNKLEYYGFTGEKLEKINALSLELNNPIDFALFPDNYNMAVIDGNEIKYFENGFEIPSSVIGLTSPISISANKSGIAVIEGNQVKHYSLSGDTFTYSSALSITSNLSNPRCVAIKPGTQDRIVIDGDEVKYYSYDGANLILNPNLSTTVEGLNNLFVYIPSAVVISKVPEGLIRDVSQVRVRAYCDVPNNTSITWSLTVNGESWVTCWRVRGTPTGSILEITKDNGSTWTNIGDASTGYPTNKDIRLMFTFDPAGQNLKWKAQLQGTSKLTPRIRAAGDNPAVKLDINTKPDKPDPDPDDKIPNPDDPIEGGCITTATPTLEWKFNDPDPGDYQTAFEIKLFTHNDIELVSKKIETDKSEYAVSSDVLFQSGEYKFKYQIRVSDKGGLWSEFSDWKEFCVVAFDFPRIREIVHPPTGQIAPNPEEDSTYIHIFKGMSKDELPKTKAGGRVGLLLNGIGLDGEAVKDNMKVFYYDNIDKSNKSAIFVAEEDYKIYETKGTNNKFLLEFYTSSNPKIVPDGTIIKGEFSGSNHNTHPMMKLNSTSPDKYADGILTTEGTVLSDWMVVLQGRKNS